MIIEESKRNVKGWRFKRALVVTYCTLGSSGGALVAPPPAVRVGSARRHLRAHERDGGLAHIVEEPAAVLRVGNLGESAVDPARPEAKEDDSIRGVHHSTGVIAAELHGDARESLAARHGRGCVARGQRHASRAQVFREFADVCLEAPGESQRLVAHQDDELAPMSVLHREHQLAARKLQGLGHVDVRGLKRNAVEMPHAVRLEEHVQDTILRVPDVTLVGLGPEPRQPPDGCTTIVTHGHEGSFLVEGDHRVVVAGACQGEHALDLQKLVPTWTRKLYQRMIKKSILLKRAVPNERLFFIDA